MMTKDQLLLYWCNLELKSNSTKDGCNFNSQRICYLIYFSAYRELWNCWLYWGHKMRGPKSQQDVFRLAPNRDLFKIPKKVVSIGDINIRLQLAKKLKYLRRKVGGISIQLYKNNQITVLYIVCALGCFHLCLFWPFASTSTSTTWRDKLT